jgi:CRP-like cAMP-binding protein
MAMKKVARTSEQKFERIYNNMCQNLAQDLEVDGVDFRVFLYLSSHVDFVEFVHIPQIELATMLGRRKEHISRSIHKLVAGGFIAEEAPRTSRWRLNPDYGK